MSLFVQCFSLGAFYENAGLKLNLGTFNTCSGKLMGLAGYGNEKTVQKQSVFLY